MINNGSMAMHNANEVIFGVGVSPGTVDQRGIACTLRSTGLGTRTEDITMAASHDASADQDCNGNAWVLHKAAF